MTLISTSQYNLEKIKKDLIITPTVSIDEELRLLALKSFKILDTLPEAIYDNLTRLACETCGTPVALVSLVDKNRQWFKSKLGFDTPETSREISFCAHAINQQGIFEIENALEDERFINNPLVISDPGVIFYAGAPLETSEGHKIGTLCVIDHKPKKLSESQKKILTLLADQVVSLIELTGASNTLVETGRREREIMTESKLNQAYLKTTLMSIGDAVIGTSAGPDPQILFLNSVAENLTGWTLSEALGRNVHDVFKIINVNTRESAFDPVSKVLKDGKVSELANHTALISRSGCEYIIEDSAAPIIDESGKILGVVLVFRDVTEKDALRQRSELLNAVIENSKDFIGIAKPDGKAFYVNPAGRSLVGLESLGDATQTQILDYFAPSERSRVTQKLIPEIINHGFWDGRTLFKHFVTGEEIPFSWNAFSIPNIETGNVSAIACVSRDLRSQERREKAMTQVNRAVDLERNKFAAMFDVSPIGLALVVGNDLRFEMVNRKFIELVSPRSYVGRTWSEVYDELPNSELIAIIQNTLLTGNSYQANEMPLEVRGDSDLIEKRYYDFTYSRILDSDHFPYCVVIQCLDVTARVRARKEMEQNQLKLKESEDNLSAAVEVAKVGFYTWDISNDHLVFSKQMQADWGIGADFSLADAVKIIIPEDQQRVSEAINQTLTIGAPYNIQYRIKRPSDGHVIWVEVSGTVSYDDIKKPVRFFGTSIDISSRKAQEAKLEAIANSIPQMAWTADSFGARTWFNDQWFKYSGVKMENVKGWGWLSLQHPDEVNRVEKKYRKHMQSGLPWEDTYPIRSATGEYRWFLSKANPIRDDKGAVVRWFGTNTDVTAQRQAELQLTRLASVIESSSDFIAMTDEKLKPIFINRAGREMTGFGDQEVSQMSVPEFFADDEQNLISDIVLPTLLRDGLWQGELHFKNFKTGALIPVLYNLFALKDPATQSIFGYATVARDTSERRRFENHLLRARQDAENANAAKSTFLANMSHEIRSPLGAIMGFAELIKQPGLANTEMINYASVIERNSHHLLRIIDDILDLSKVEAGKMLIENIDFSISDLLADFSSLMAFRAREKAIDFELQTPSMLPSIIKADPTRIRQILMNIVGNAIKFTTKGHVQLEVELSANMMTFTVSDTGSGLSAEQASQLFQPFHQADVSTTRKFGGTGLGLVLTRRLTEAMGGSFILVNSAPGSGSVFKAAIQVVVPDKATPLFLKKVKQKSTLIKEIPFNFAGRRVLLIEDSPDNQVLISLILSKVGILVEIASDGYDGVNAAASNNFDLVLCDVQMPRMDGHQTVRELRSRGFDKPIIALTAHAMKEERDKAKASGFDDYLTKPINRAALIETLIRFFK